MSWHLITCEYPPDVGGISDHTAQLASGLAAAGDEVHVYCPGRARPAAGGVHLHPVLGTFSSADLRRAGERIDACPGSRRLVIQWVPHGFGQRSLNLGFCLWVARRARAGDLVDIVVHEPYLDFGWGPLRHLAMAAVHRLMTAVLLRAADRVWISTPAWEVAAASLRARSRDRDAVAAGARLRDHRELRQRRQADARNPGTAARRPLRHLRRGASRRCSRSDWWG